MGLKHGNVDIEVLEGETIEDAIKRLAEAQTPKKEKKEKPVTVSDPNSGSPIDSSIYSALHIYQREGEPDGIVRSNATRERKMHGPGALVFAHLHSFGAECTPSCKERVL